MPRSHPRSAPPPGVAQEIERAVKSRSGRREGDEIRFRCPYPDRHTNGDADPSARYSPTKHVWRCDACGQSGGWTKLADLLDVQWRSAGPNVETSYQYTDEDGELLFEVVRKSNPKGFRQRRPDGSGGWVWNTKGVRRVLYRLPEVIAAVQGAETVYVVEGEKDADNLVERGLVATTNPGGAGKWRRSYTEPLRGARVVVLHDNDKPGKSHGQKVAKALHGVAGDIRLVDLPGLATGGDVSDWIATRQLSGIEDEAIRAELEHLVSTSESWGEADEGAPPAGQNEPPYRATKQGLVHLKATKDGEVEVPLTNFGATIVAEIRRDDGAEIHSAFEIEAHLDGRAIRFEVRCTEFARMDWAIRNLGPTAIVNAGFSAKDHARAAIQHLSRDVDVRTVFGHLGWRSVDDAWVYLHAAGAIGPVGTVPGVEVDLLEQLQHYELPSRRQMTSCGERFGQAWRFCRSCRSG